MARRRTKFANLEPDLRVGNYYVYKRPGADAFLFRLRRQGHQIAIWSSCHAHNGLPIVRQLFPMVADRSTFFRDWCELRENYKSIKNLEALWQRWPEFRNKTLIIDDSPEKIAQPECYRQVARFEGDPRDRDLYNAKVTETDVIFTHDEHRESPAV